MNGEGGKFIMSQAEQGEKAFAKWWSVNLVTSTAIILTLATAVLPSALCSVQQTAEFVFLVVAPGLWNCLSTWITVPCLYVFLNIVLVTLAFVSRAPPTSTDDRSHNYGIISTEIEFIDTITDADADHGNIIVESKLAHPVESNFTPVPCPAQVQKPTAAVVWEGRSKSFTDLKATLTPASALYGRKSGLRKSTRKLRNLHKDCRERREMINTESCTPAAPKTSPPDFVVFEISTDVGNDYTQLHEEDEEAMVEGDEDTNMLHHEEEGMALSAEELYVKAELFIGDFYRQLKMQREDSWNRLCGRSS